MIQCRILGIDPGPIRSAFVEWTPNRILSHGIYRNEELLEMFRAYTLNVIPVIEMVQSFGMPVGREVFETVLIIGRLLEVFSSQDPKLVYRKDIKLHFCQSPRAKDSNIRQALIDRFGSPGTKKNPGILYGIRADEWSALAVAVYYQDRTGN